ncbi:MAG TPA: hypothetical protein VML55_25180, partial [Planctomycetaceae bacterium]|nr:hypothetical protein [Planctomycetaceae bacterium]
MRTFLAPGLVLMLAGGALAEIVRGTIKNVSPREIIVTVADGDDGAQRKFAVSSSTNITLDQRRTRTDGLQAGQEVTIFTDRDDVVLRVAARTSPAPRTSDPAGKPPAAETGAAGTPARPANRREGAERTRERPARGDDRESAGTWPQFRGPDRDNVSRETGLLQRWPDGGPPLAWTASGLGEGYSTVSVDQGLVFTMGNVGEDESVLALD